MFEKPCRILVGRGSVPSGASRAMRSPWPTLQFWKAVVQTGWKPVIREDLSTRTGKAIPLGDLVDRFDVLDANQFLIQAAVEIGESIGIQAHLVQDRRVKLFDVQRPFYRGRPKFVRRARR